MNKTELTQEQKRIKIAESCGWTIIAGYSACGWIDPETHILYAIPPDYFTDLNAMHEAIAAMNDYQKVEFVENLKQVTRAYSSTYRHVFEMLTSTPAQRAEAFGKTLGLW